MAVKLRPNNYSGVSHKAGMSPDSGTAPTDPVPVWTPDVDKLRIGAYARYRAMIETVGREFLAQDAAEDKRKAWREFGDAAALVQRVAAAILGDDPVLSVWGADDPVPDFPELRPPPTKPASLQNAASGPESNGAAPPADPGVETPEDDQDPLERLQAEVYAEALALWEETERAKVAQWQEDQRRVPKLQGRQDWLRAWDEAVGLIGMVVEMEEEHTVPMGDGILALGWDPRKLRPAPVIHRPDAYFPVVSGASPGDFPDTVHLVWEFPGVDAKGKPIDLVRRVTYQLLTTEGAPLTLKWKNPDGTDPAPPTHQCFLTDVTTEAKNLKKADLPLEGSGHVYASFLDATGKPVELNQHPIGLNFVPLIHFTHNLTSIEHFGRSYLARLIQVLDEIAAQDTDAALASRWAARPPVAVSGMAPGDKTLDMTPGKAIRLGQGGQISTIDMAQNLEVILERLGGLLKRLSVNGQVPEGILGRVDASEVPSGLALTLSFTPFEQLVGQGRRARKPKYGLVAEFAQKIAIQNDDPTLAGDLVVYPSGLEFGTFMPADLTAAVAAVGALRTARLTSQSTGIQYLQDEGGYPRVDIDDEIAAIREEDGETANLISEATGSSKYGAQFLGIDGFEEPEAVDENASAGGLPPGAGIGAPAPPAPPAPVPA